MEAMLPAPEIRNEAREEYEKQSITQRPLAPNLMIVLGIILAVGASPTILGAADGGQGGRDFYQSLRLLLFAAGISMASAGYYLNRRRARPAPASQPEAER